MASKSLASTPLFCNRLSTSSPQRAHTLSPEWATRQHCLTIQSLHQMLSVLNTECFSISGRADIQRPHGFSFMCNPVKICLCLSFLTPNLRTGLKISWPFTSLPKVSIYLSLQHINNCPLRGHWAWIVNPKCLRRESL